VGGNNPLWFHPICGGNGDGDPADDLLGHRQLLEPPLHGRPAGADTTWDWEQLASSSPLSCDAYFSIYCKDLISVLLSILYSPLFSTLAGSHLGWDVHCGKNCIFSQFIFFWEIRPGGHIRELKLEGILSNELFIGLVRLEIRFCAACNRAKKSLHTSSVLTRWNMNLLSTMFCLYII